MVSARKRLGRGSELYAEFSALLIDLMHGDLSSLDRIDAGLFERDATSADHVLVEESRRAGEVALAAMQASMDTPSSSWSPRWMIRRSPTPGRWPCVYRD